MLLTLKDVGTGARGSSVPIGGRDLGSQTTHATHNGSKINFDFTGTATWQDDTKLCGAFDLSNGTSCAD